MKRLKRWLLPVLTLLLAALGAGLPFAVSSLQDAYTDSRTDRRQFDPVSLTLQKDQPVQQFMLMKAAGYTLMPWQGETRRSEEEVWAAAEEALSLLFQWELLSSEEEGMAVWEGLTLQPYMAIPAADASFPSMLLWEVFSEKFGCNLFIDDATGKMIRVSGPSPPLGLDGLYEALYDSYAGGAAAVDGADAARMPDAWREELDARLEELTAVRLDQWIVFCEEYYGVSVRDIRVEEALWDGLYRQYKLRVSWGGDTPDGEFDLWLDNRYTNFN